MIVDATTQEPMVGVEIEVYDYSDQRTVQADLTTGKSGTAELDTALVDMFFKAKKDKYAELQDHKNRIKYCSDPTNCVINFAMSKKLNSDAVHPKGCYFTAKKDDHGVKQVKFK